MIDSFNSWLPWVIIAGLFAMCSYHSRDNELVAGNSEKHELVAKKHKRP